MPTLERSPRSALLVTGWWLTAALVLARLLPMTAQPGMFIDGNIYAAISRNMAVGEGGLWHPHYASGGESGYCEMPTLALWLDSFAFRLCGDHFWVEKLNSALTGLATAGILAAIWRTLFRADAKLAASSWLPVALWVCLPSWSWMYENNLLENPLGMFAAASVYCSLRAAIPGATGQRSRPGVVWIVGAGVCLAAGCLSKGPVGLFPLVAPLTIALTLRWQRPLVGLAMTAAVGVVGAGIIGLLLLQDGAADYLLRYLHAQVAASLLGQRETVHSALGRFDVLWKIVQQLILPTAIAWGLIAWGRRRGHSLALSQTVTGPILFGLLTGTSASLPIMLSPKQSGHYAFPSFAFYALGLAAWCAPSVVALLESPASFSWQRRLRYAAAGAIGLLLIATVVLAGRTHRDKEIYHDALAVGQVVPRRTIVGASAELARDYALQSYLTRWDDLRIDVGSDDYEYCLGLRNDSQPPAGFQIVAASLQRYQLYRRIEGATIARQPRKAGTPLGKPGSAW